MLVPREFSVAKPEAVANAAEAVEMLGYAARLATKESLPHPGYLVDANRRLSSSIALLNSAQTSESNDHLAAIGALHIAELGIQKLAQFDKS
jgi:hypothetical protein